MCLQETTVLNKLKKGEDANKISKVFVIYSGYLSKSGLKSGFSSWFDNKLKIASIGGVLLHFRVWFDGVRI